MTVVPHKVYSASDTGFVLRQMLGDVFVWEDRLADMRRGRVTTNPRLLPFGIMKDKGCKRPVYARADIRAFIVAYRLFDKSCGPNLKPVPITAYDVTSVREWKSRRLTAVCPSSA